MILRRFVLQKRSVSCFDCSGCRRRLCVGVVSPFLFESFGTKNALWDVGVRCLVVYLGARSPPASFKRKLLLLLWSH